MAVTGHARGRRWRPVAGLAAGALAGALAGSPAAAAPVPAYLPSSGAVAVETALVDDATGRLRRLPAGTTAASVSPDGTQVAFVGADPWPEDPRTTEREMTSWLRVQPAAGGAAVDLELRRPEYPGTAPGALAGRPLWSPDGRAVAAVVDGGTSTDRRRNVRLVCVVATGACARRGRTPSRTRPSATDPSDLLAWGTDGLLAGERSAAVPDAAHARCGAPPTSVPGPTLTVRAVTGGPAGTPPLRLRAGSDPLAPDTLEPGSAAVLAVADGTLAFETPGTRSTTSRVRCSRRAVRWTRSTVLGTARVLVRRAGRVVRLRPPAGARGGEGLRLVPDGSGGAFVVTRPVTQYDVPVRCRRRPGRRPDCHPHGDQFALYRGRPLPDRPARVWRYRPGALALVPVGGLPGVVRDALARALDVVPAAPGTVAVATQDGVDRVGLDPGAVPVAVLRRPGRLLPYEDW